MHNAGNSSPYERNNSHHNQFFCDVTLYEYKYHESPRNSKGAGNKMQNEYRAFIAQRILKISLIFSFYRLTAKIRTSTYIRIVIKCSR